MEYTFPENLKEIRKSQRLTQNELAQRAGLTQATLSAYEAGLIYPRLDKIYDLAKVLDVEVGELVR